MVELFKKERCGVAGCRRKAVGVQYTGATKGWATYEYVNVCKRHLGQSVQYKPERETR